MLLLLHSLLFLSRMPCKHAGATSAGMFTFHYTFRRISSHLILVYISTDIAIPNFTICISFTVCIFYLFNFHLWLGFQRYWLCYILIFSISPVNDLLLSMHNTNNTKSPLLILYHLLYFIYIFTPYSNTTATSLLYFVSKCHLPFTLLAINSNLHNSPLQPAPQYHIRMKCSISGPILPQKLHI